MKRLGIILSYLLTLFMILSMSGCSPMVILNKDADRDISEVEARNGENDQDEDDDSEEKLDDNEDTSEHDDTEDTSGLKIYPGYLEITKGTSLKLYAYTESENTPPLDWKTSNKSVVSVNDDGTITAKAIGEATIEASLMDDPDVKAVCIASVVEKGPTLLYNTVPERDHEDPDKPKSGSKTNPGGGNKTGEPDNPDGDDTGEKDDSDRDDKGENGSSDNDTGDTGESNDQDSGSVAEENIPIEYDGSIPVEVIPKIDEFNWTIEFFDTDYYTNNIAEAAITLYLNGYKNGGKTKLGTYKCTGFTTVEVNNEEQSQAFNERVNMYPDLDFGDFTCKVEKFNFEKLYPEETDPDQKEANEEKYNAMAYGNLRFTLLGGAEVGKRHTDYNTSAEFPYKMKFTKDGLVVLTYITKATTDYKLFFEGRLYKKPIRPK